MAIFSTGSVCRRDHVSRIGLAILAGVFVAIIAAWTLWWRFTNEPRVHLMLFFRSSVHGVDIGSPVKISGVKVGQIESLGVRVPLKKGDDYYAAVRVVMDGDLLASKGLPRELEDPAYLKDEIRRGLRGRLQLISAMTGDMYLELEYQPKEPAVLVANESERIAEVPALDDPLSTGIIGVTHRLAELDRTDFPRIGEEISRRLDAIDLALPPSSFKDAGEEAKRRLEDIRVALASPALREKIARVNADLVAVREALARYDAKTGDGAAGLAAAAAKFRADLEAVSAETDLIGRAMNPRSPGLLMTYARFAVVRDNAAKVRRLCDDIVNANGYVTSLFKAISTDPEAGAAK